MKTIGGFSVPARSGVHPILIPRFADCFHTTMHGSNIHIYFRADPVQNLIRRDVAVVQTDQIAPDDGYLIGCGAVKDVMFHVFMIRERDDK